MAIDAPTNKQETALTLAAHFGNVELVKMLLTHGPERRLGDWPPLEAGPLVSSGRSRRVGG